MAIGCWDVSVSNKGPERFLFEFHALYGEDGRQADSSSWGPTSSCYYLGYLLLEGSAGAANYKDMIIACNVAGCWAFRGFGQHVECKIWVVVIKKTLPESPVLSGFLS
jgi:hypothetical protein